MERIKPRNISSDESPITTSFSILPSQVKLMDDEAERTGLSRSEVLREILAMYFKLPEE